MTKDKIATKKPFKERSKLFFQDLKSEFQTKNYDFRDIAIKCGILYVFLFLSLIHSVFVFVTMAVASIFIIFENSARKIYYMIFLLPFLNIIRRNTGELYYSIILWCLVLLTLAVDLFIKVFIKKEKKINWLFTIATILLLAYITFVGEWDFTTTCAAYLTIVICYCVYYYIGDFDFKEVLFIFFLGVLLACFSGLFRPVFARAQDVIPYFYYYGRRFTGVSNDPNYYSGDLLMILAGFMILYDKEKIKNLFYVALTFLTIFAIWSLSKMMLLIYAILLFSFCLITLIRRFFKEGFKRCLIVAGCVLLSCCVCVKPISALTNRIFNPTVPQEQVVEKENADSENSDEDLPGDNQTEESEKTEESEYEIFLKNYKYRNNKLTKLSTGRTNIWIAYLEKSFSSPKTILFGHGIGAPFILCDNGVKIGYLAEHNTFVQMIYRLGIVGSALLLFMIFAAVRKCKIKKFTVSNLLVAFVIFGLFMALCNLLSYRLSIYILILSQSLIYGSEDKLKNKKDEGV